MPLFGRKHRQEHVRAAVAPAAAPTPTDLRASGPAGWADINGIRSEWPESQLNAEEDLRAWQEGIRLYDNDDYASMMRCGNLLSQALAHSLYGEGILRGTDLPETVHKVLYCSLSAPPDGRTFNDTAQRPARLALTIIRENGWQPAGMGGSGLFDQMIMDKGNYMLLAAAVAPGDRAWEGDLKGFFAVPPQPVVESISHSPDDTIDRMQNMLQRVALSNAGRVAEALESEERAARLGSVEGMVNAGISNETLGNRVQAEYWFGQAAELGDARGHRYLLEYEGGGAAAPATRFLRVWAATYEVDAATSTHTSRTVSGDTRDDVLATALRRTPPGSRLVYMCREDDFETTWTEADGFTPKADEPHEFRPPGPRLFKELAIGDHFRRGYTLEQVFQKVDERHARNTSGGAPFEIDPYDGAY